MNAAIPHPRLHYRINELFIRIDTLCTVKSVKESLGINSRYLELSIAGTIKHRHKINLEPHKGMF